MVKGIGGLGFLDSRHCEKTSYIVFASIVAFLFLLWQAYTANYVPEITINNEPISYLLIAGIIALAGYIGVLFYKISNKKVINLKTMIFFWSDK